MFGVVKQIAGHVFDARFLPTGEIAQNERSARFLTGAAGGSATRGTATTTGTSATAAARSARRGVGFQQIGDEFSAVAREAIRTDARNNRDLPVGKAHNAERVARLWHGPATRGATCGFDVGLRGVANEGRELRGGAELRARRRELRGRISRRLQLRAAGVTPRRTVVGGARGGADDEFPLANNRRDGVHRPLAVGGECGAGDGAPQIVAVLRDGLLRRLRSQRGDRGQDGGHRSGGEAGGEHSHHSTSFGLCCTNVPPCRGGVCGRRHSMCHDCRLRRSYRDRC